MQEKPLVDVVEIIEFTDPVCTWCWGSEPILRRLETHYGERVQIRFVMGGLVNDIRTFYDSHNDIGRDPERSNTQIAKHWLEASARHGMPVQSEGFRLFSDAFPSSYPQNIAYKAAQMEDEALANRFLRKMREATAAEAKQSNRPEVLIELAAETGLDVPKFIERISDGSAEAAFQQDLDTAARVGARGFPTFLVRYGEKGVLLRGYQRFETFQSVIKTITDGAVKDEAPAPSEANVLAFIGKHGRVAPVEIQAAFDFSHAELAALLDRLQDAVRVVPAGNGWFVDRLASPLFCDAETGLCAM